MKIQAAAEGALAGTPLWPTGHLPPRGGDGRRPRFRLIWAAAKQTVPTKLLISPLEGEMSGRTEGGAYTRRTSIP